MTFFRYFQGFLSFHVPHNLGYSLLATTKCLPLLCDQVLDACQLFHERELAVRAVFLSLILCILSFAESWASLVAQMVKNLPTTQES